jgi:hypothetical protein
MKRTGWRGRIGGGISLALIISLLMPWGSLMAKERQGARLIVFKKDGAQLEGELIAVRRNLLLVMPEAESEAVFVDISDVAAITLVKKSKALSGLGWGALAGLVVGGAVGIAGASTVENPWNNYAGAGAIMLAGIGAGAGALLGLIFGAAAGIDRAVRVERLDQAQLRSFMRSLWSEAKIQNYT